MASPGQDILSPSAMTAQSSLAGLNGTAAAYNNMPQALDTSDRSPVDAMHDQILFPTQSSLHPLPSKPTSQVSPQNATSTTPTSSTPVPAQPKPRIVGGFEVDDYPEDEEDGTQDGKDELDVYDPSIGCDFDAPTPAQANPNPLDRTSQSPEQEIGITPAPVPATGSPADISSFTLPTGVSQGTPRAQTATPAQSAVDAPTKTSPPRSHVNGSIAPDLSKSRLAHDVVGILEDRIKEDPRGDIAAYFELIEEFKSRNKQDDVRRIYEQYLSVFPLAVCVSPHPVLAFH